MECDQRAPMRFFEHGHLPGHLQAVSKPFSDLAHLLMGMLPGDPERTIALDRLREAKDRAVALVAITTRAAPPAGDSSPSAPEGDSTAAPDEESAYRREVTAGALAALKRAQVRSEELREELARERRDRLTAVRDTRRLDGDLLIGSIMGFCPGVLDRETTRRVAEEVVAAMASHGHTVLRGIELDPWALEDEVSGIDAPNTGECIVEPPAAGDGWVEWAVCAPDHPGGGMASLFYGGGGELVGDDGGLAARRFAERVPGAWVTWRRVRAGGWSA